jgi:site-specific recombinase XerD
MFRDKHRSSRGGVADRGDRLTAPILAPRCDAVSSDDALESLLRTMREERGLAAATLHNRARALRPFLAWLAARGRPWHETSAEDVTGYLASQSRWSRATIAQHVHSLRSFFRHGAEQGWCLPHVAAQIDAPRLYRHERLPQGPPWTHVRELLDAHRGDTASQLRNRAMLLLLTVYGFRSGEVRGLTLDDLDWDQEVIRPPRPKQRKVGHYPLVREVGDAILAYLTRARPRCACREVFVRLRPPYQPLTAGGLATLVCAAQKRLGRELPHYGPHSLRHANATHLLGEGFTLKEIGDHLGHTSVRATEIYAKVDVSSLRLVADLDLSALVEHARSCEARETPFFDVGQLAALREVARVSLGGVL